MVRLPELPDSRVRNYEHSVSSTSVCFLLSLSHSPLIFLYFGALCLYDQDPTVHNVRGLCCLFSPVLELQTFRSTSFLSRSSFLVSAFNLLLLQFWLIPRFLFSLYTLFTFLFSSFAVSPSNSSSYHAFAFKPKFCFFSRFPSYMSIMLPLHLILPRSSSIYLIIIIFLQKSVS